LYFQIFLLISFFDKKKPSQSEVKGPVEYLSTTIIVPCYNEEKTVEKTVESLLDLNYPPDKLTIMVVNDGSTDNTWEIVQKYVDEPRVKLYQKENEGSKFA